MGHELDQTAGKVSFADSRRDAWHQLGQQIGHAMTVDEALDAAFMRGWNVRKIELTDIEVTDPDTGKRVRFSIPGRFATVRTNPHSGGIDGLGTVGRVWTAFQNEATADMLNGIVDASGAHVETIGALRGGRDTFITMLMPDHMEFRSPITGDIDRTALYLSILNNHTGEAPLRAMISPVRIVCANTWRMAEGSARSSAVLRHVGEPAGRMQEIRDLLGLTFAYQEAFMADVARLIDREVADDFVRGVVNDVFGVTDAPTDRARDGRIVKATQVMEVYRQSVTVAPFKGTAFGAYNAITEYVDHFMPVQGKENQADKRALRTLTSTDVADLKASAFTALLPA